MGIIVEFFEEIDVISKETFSMECFAFDYFAR